MRILFLHGWHSVPGGVKPTYLKDQGHTVINPALDDDDFAAALATAQAEFDKHQPDVVVGSSRGGAVAMNINSGNAKLVLLCPAWKKWGTVKRVKPGTVILHSRADDVIPFADSEELAGNSGTTVIEVGTDHWLADPEPLEAMLRVCEVHQFLYSPLDALTSQIAVLDENGVILSVNEAWRRFADENGYAGTNYGVGSNYVEVSKQGARGGGDSTIPTGLRDVLSGRMPFFEVEYPCHSPNEQRWFVMRVTRYKSPGPVRVVVAHENVTQRKQAEIALKDADRRKDEFLAMLSHELRNPLASITTATRLLNIQQNDNRIQHEACTTIDRQVRQLTRLIDDLMEVSRISTGKVYLQQERVVLNAVVENAVETVRPLLNQRRHELALALSKEPIWLDADAARLEQVVVNLLINAAKYTNEGGKIWLTVQQEGDQCVLRVRDTGVGIAPELLPHVFDPFTQAEQAIDRSQGGLGIGLTLVQRIVKMHRGRVEVYSKLRQGSEFVVHLPVMAAPVPQPPSTHEATAKPIQATLRVLIVDDIADNRQMLEMLLSASGTDVLTAHDGPSALEAALDFDPQIVLMDIGLPGMNGYEVAKRIRQQAIFKNVVLVAMTGYGRESDRQLSQEAGFDHHLVKPVDFSKLEQILANVPEQGKRTLSRLQSDNFR